MVLERGGETGLDALLAEIVRKRDGLRAFIDADRRTSPAAFGALLEEFGFSPRRQRRSHRRVGLAAARLRAAPSSTLSPRRAEATDARSVLNNILPLCRAGLSPRAIRSAGWQLLCDGLPQGRRRCPTTRRAPSRRRCSTGCPICRSAMRRGRSASSEASDRLALFRMLEGDARRADHRRLADRAATSS